MTKRSKSQMMYQPGPPNKRKGPNARLQGKQAGSAKQTAKQAGSKSAARSYARSSQAAPGASAPTNLRTVRIAAMIVAAAAIIGGVIWALSIQSNQAGYGSGQIIGLVLLGFLAGLGIAVAIRTENMMAQVSKFMRARR